MPRFFSTRRVQPTEEEQRAAEIDLERIRKGGIPAGAEARLKRVANSSQPFFTSDLSAKEYALGQLGGLQPLAQVMGSTVIQSGWSGFAGAGQWDYGSEVRALSEPWNMARALAFNRLRHEAEFAGADGVTGVKVNWGRIGSGDLELVVFGTAVRDTVFDNHKEDHGLGLCTLSGQEVDKLRRIGATPVGVVGYTTVQAVRISWWNSYSSMSAMSSPFGRFNQRNMEIPDVSQGVYDARYRAMSEVERQAKGFGANEIVISELRHHIEHHEYEDYNDNKVHVFLVTLHVLGTAVKLGAHPPYPTPLSGPAMTINLGK